MFDAVSQAIVGSHRSFCASLRVLLAHVAEHEAGELYTTIGARSEADFLVRTLGVSFRTARSWVELARGLQAHPELGESLEAGDLSVDKLSSLLELLAHHADPPPPTPPDPPPDGPPADPWPDAPPADPSPDSSPEPSPEPDPSPSGSSVDDLLDLAGHLSAGQLAGQARRARDRSREDADRRWRQRRFCATHVPDDGQLSFRGGQLFDDQAAIVWAALMDYASTCAANPETGSFDPQDVRFADALVAMAHAYLRDRTRLTSHPVVIFHADSRILAGDDSWAETLDYSPLAAATIQRLACDCRLGLVADDPHGNPLNMGRRLRTANWQQQQAVLRRDGGCRTCGQKHFIQIHHLAWWDRHRGPTNLDNLIGQCDRCHHLIHHSNFTIQGHPNRELRLISPDGTVLHRSHPQPQPPPAPTRSAPPHAPPRLQLS